MKIVLAPNSFKESLSAWQVAVQLEKGLKKALPGVETIKIPMADGGDGTLQSLVRGTSGRISRVKTVDPLGREIWAEFGLLGGGESAAVEMAAASGLRLLKPGERNPMKASTFGTGELLARAFAKRHRVIVGVGGSATVDGGCGLAEALGYRFLDGRGRALKMNGGALKKIARIDPDDYLRRWSGLSVKPDVVVACDVTNPLLGKRGAAPVYGPQKGATPKQVKELEEGLENLANCVKADLGLSIRTLKGGGAAGGLAAGLVAFCGARIEPGAAYIGRTLELEKHIQGADWILTGEGKLDSQTAFGKAPAFVAERGRAAGVPVVAVAGSISDDAEKLLAQDIFQGVFSLCDGPMSLEKAMSDTPRLLKKLGLSLGTLFKAASRK